MPSHSVSSRLAHSHSHTSKRSVASSSNAPKPLSIQRLEQLSLEIEASLKRADVRYVLRVHHRSTRTRWSFNRSFDEYRAFQRRLLSVMRQGHTCQAECPWLFSFVSSYFPKSSVFCLSRGCVVTQRTEALNKVLTQVHAFLLSRANHSCSVTHAVAEEFAKFVGTDMIEQIPVDKDLLSHGSSSSSLYDAERASSDSLLSTTSTDEESLEEQHCAICELPIGDSDPTHHHYTTVLSCGHEFHDECIVAKLNESMTCPVCGHAEL